MLARPPPAARGCAGRPPARARRAGAGAALSLGLPSRRCRSARSAASRSVDVGLVDPGRGGLGWATSPSRRRSARCFAGVGAAAALALMRRFPRALVAARPRRCVVGCRARRSHLRRPGRPRPALQPLHARCPRAARAATSSSWRARRASRSARSTRSTPAGARPAPTPTSPGWAAPSASSSTTSCCKDFTRDEDAPRRRPRARRTCTTATSRAACSSSRSSAPRGAVRGGAADASPGAAEPRAPAPAALPALALVDRGRQRRSSRSSPTSSRAASRRAPTRYALRLTGDAGAVHRLPAPDRAAQRRRPRPARLAHGAARHPPDDGRADRDREAFEAGAR